VGPGFKYHVITISAIFLALTVGLVVGSLTVSPRLVRTFSGALHNLNITVQQDLAAKRQQVANYQKFLDKVMPSLVQKDLQGQAVTLIQVGDYSDPIPAIQTVVSQAGGEVVNVITLQHILSDDGSLLDQRLNELHSDHPNLPPTRAKLLNLLATTLVKGENASDPVLGPLQDAGLISFHSSYPIQPVCHRFVLLAGSHADATARVTAVDAPLIAALQHLGATVVMCEPQNAAVSDVPVYHALGLQVPTIDNVDDRIGLYSLVLTLQGGVGGDFGVKPTAKDLIPTPSSS